MIDTETTASSNLNNDLVVDWSYKRIGEPFGDVSNTTDFLLSSINSYPNEFGVYGDVSNINIKQDAYYFLNWHRNDYWQVYRIN